MKSMIPYSNLLVLTAALSTQVAVPTKSLAQTLSDVTKNEQLKSNQSDVINKDLTSHNLIRFKQVFQDEYTVGHLRLFFYKEKREVDTQNQLKPEMWGYTSIINQDGYASYSFLSQDIALDLIHQDKNLKEYQILNCESTFSSCDYVTNKLQVYDQYLVLFLASDVKVEQFNEKTQSWEQTDRLIFFKENLTK